jgi:hypothetical protein
MPRFTIRVDVDEPAELRAVAEWMDRWEPKLPFLSENCGCGCHVYLYDVEGPEEAMAELPGVVLTDSDWSRGEWSRGRQPE